MNIHADDVLRDWERWFVPPVYPMTLLQIAEDGGLQPEALLRQAGVRVSAREIAETGLTLGTHLPLLTRVADLLGEAAVGVELGWRLPPTALGTLGYALLSSPTLGDALTTLQRFWHLVGQGLVLTADVHDGLVHLELRASLFITERLRKSALESTMTSIVRGVTALAPGSLDTRQTELWFDFDEPDHAAIVRERLGVVRYGMPTTKAMMPAASLSTPLIMANPVGFRKAVEWCAREEKERGLESTHLVARVESELRLEANGYPSFPQIARRSHMSPRTLRRRLEGEGTSYAVLMEAARRRDALRLLDNPALSVRDVAELLGYENPANFTRAFKRWTGRTPTAHRASR
ncbi:MAG: AraC family transcriptional regulator ligand-binding domain-containing protein [Polyangiales bacterium]